MIKFESLGRKVIFVYDLEFIGDVHNHKTCKIWDISILCVSTGETFNTVVDPDSTCQNFPPPVVEGLFDLTRKFLNENRALTFNRMWPRIVQWVENRTFGNKAIFISHNNFSSDKPVLENHMLTYGTTIPTNWLFFDSLHYFRDNIKNLHDYSLKGMVKYLMEIEHTDAHRAYIDTVRLTECLNIFTGGRWGLSGTVLPAFATSLRTLKGVGSMVETVFMKNDITCEEVLQHNLNNLVQLGYQQNRNPQTVMSEYIYNILFRENVPVENIKLVTQSIFFNYIRLNTINNVFN